MPEIDFSMNDVENYQALQLPSGEYNPITLALIQTFQWIGIPQLTLKNLKEFHRRMQVLGMIGLNYIEQETGEEGSETIMRNPLYAEIAAHIGLRVECDRLTKAKFRNKIMNTLEDAATALAEQELEVITTAADTAVEEVVDPAKPLIWTPKDS